MVVHPSFEFPANEYSAVPDSARPHSHDHALVAGINSFAQRAEAKSAGDPARICNWAGIQSAAEMGIGPEGRW